MNFLSWNADILRNSLISDFEIRAEFPVESTLWWPFLTNVSSRNIPAMTFLAVSLTYALRYQQLSRTQKWSHVLKLWTFHTSLTTPKDLHLLHVSVSGIVFPLRGKPVRNPKLFLCGRLGMSSCYSWWVSCIRFARRKTIWIFSGARNSFITGRISKKQNTTAIFPCFL